MGRLTLLICLLLSSAVLGNSVMAQQTVVGEFLGAKNTVYPPWFKESFLEFEDDIDEAAENNKRLILYFHQDGCPYCNKLVEHNFADPAISAHIQKNFDVVSLNMWGDREVVQVGGQPFTEKTLAAALNVDFTPTLIFFAENRDVALRLNGYLPPDRFLTALDYVAGKKEKEISYSRYVSSLGQGKAEGSLNQNPWATLSPVDLSNKNNQPTLVLFEEPDCKQCDLLYGKTFKDKYAPDLLAQFNVIQLNRWSDTSVTLFDGTTISANKWSDALGLNYAPSMALFGPDGEEVIKVTAMFKTFHILGVLDYVASGAYIEEPNFQRFLTARAEHIRETGEDVDIWKY